MMRTTNSHPSIAQWSVQALFCGRLFTRNYTSMYWARGTKKDLHQLALVTTVRAKAVPSTMRLYAS